MIVSNCNFHLRLLSFRLFCQLQQKKRKSKYLQENHSSSSFSTSQPILRTFVHLNFVQISDNIDMQLSNSKVETLLWKLKSLKNKWGNIENSPESFDTRRTIISNQSISKMGVSRARGFGKFGSRGFQKWRMVILNLISKTRTSKISCHIPFVVGNFFKRHLWIVVVGNFFKCHLQSVTKSIFMSSQQIEEKKRKQTNFKTSG